MWKRKVLPHWFHASTNSTLGKQFIKGHAASSDGRHDVSLTLIYGMPVPLPPLAERSRAIAEVERHVALVLTAEATVEANLKRAERLRQAILKRAFEGKLVPQDPEDESASLLLERIRAEREAALPDSKLNRQGVPGSNQA